MKCFVISELHIKQDMGINLNYSHGVPFSNCVSSIKLPLLLQISIQHTITIFVIAKSV